jgi:hypothetical protein
VRIARIIPGAQLHGRNTVTLQLIQDIIERQLGQQGGKDTDFHVIVLLREFDSITSA